MGVLPTRYFQFFSLFYFPLNKNNRYWPQKLQQNIAAITSSATLSNFMYFYSISANHARTILACEELCSSNSFKAFSKCSLALSLSSVLRLLSKLLSILC